MPNTHTSEKMALLDALQMERSKKHIDKIAEWVLQDPGRLDALMEICLGPEPRQAEWAAWVVGTIGQKKPAIFRPWFPEMVGVLHQDKVHGSLKRNILRVFQEMDMPENLQESCADACFKLLENQQEEIAIRAFSMSVLAGICKKIPEMWPALKMLLEQDLKSPSPACVNRAQKVLQKFEK